MKTIVALATAVGRSAIGVIRLSGPESLSIIRGLIGSDFDPQPNTISLRTLKDPRTKSVIDQALVTYFQAPHSYTGEDVVEISCHGSPVVLRLVLDFTLYLGAVLADPGEFTLRSLAHGKINLSQAEAIRDLINARTENAARQAVLQLNGELSLALAPVREGLLSVIVILESALEFEEEDLPAIRVDEVRSQLDAVIAGVESLARTFSAGHLLSTGLKVAIAGRPNVGKSSLFNALVGLERAIVTEIPGTTRDSIGEQITLGSTPISLTDTAGLRVAADSIERMGIQRTHTAIAEADIVVAVLDGSSALTREDEAVLRSVQDMPHVIVINKADLPSYRNPVGSGSGELRGGISVSALTGAGIKQLQAAILAPFEHACADAVGLLVTNARHHNLLELAANALRSSVDLLGNESEEIVLLGLHDALNLLGEITGETTAEDILSKIFSTFCIGK